MENRNFNLLGLEGVRPNSEKQNSPSQTRDANAGFYAGY
jgi:hypothetical protein